MDFGIVYFDQKFGYPSLFLEKQRNGYYSFWVTSELMFHFTEVS